MCIIHIGSTQPCASKCLKNPHLLFHLHQSRSKGNSPGTRTTTFPILYTPITSKKLLQLWAHKKDCRTNKSQRCLSGPHIIQIIFHMDKGPNSWNVYLCVERIEAEQLPMQQVLTAYSTPGSRPKYLWVTSDISHSNPESYSYPILQIVRLRSRRTSITSPELAQ